MARNDPRVLLADRVAQEKKDFAKEMRRNPTPSEALLWERLRCNRLHGLHFKRQRVIRGWIADFYCGSYRLVVEVDGDSHATRGSEDARRDAALRQLAIMTLRFSVEDVTGNIESILARIVEWTTTATRWHPPGPREQRLRQDSLQAMQQTLELD